MSSSSPRPLSDPAAEASVLLCRIGLALLALAVPCAAMGARRAIFVLMPVGAVLVLVAALLDSRGVAGETLRAIAFSPASSLGLLLLFWAVLSFAWTPFPLEAATRFVKTTGTLVLAILACIALPGRTRISNLYLWPLGAGVAALVAIALALLGPAFLVAAQDGESSTLERGMLGLVVLVWPAMMALALRGRWNTAGGVAIIVALAAICVWSSPALLALAVGALVFAASAGQPARTSKILAAVFALLFLAAPALPLALEAVIGRSGSDPETVFGALQATVRAWGQITRSEGLRLITGHGIDSVMRGTLGGYLPTRTPHNVLFEVWFELGAIGALTSALLVAQGFVAFGRQAATLAPFLLAGLASALTISILGFSFSQLWWMTMVGVLVIATSQVLHGQYLAMRPKIKTARTRLGVAQQA